MPPLKNLQHEKFARALLEEPSQAAAYSKVYKQDLDIAKVNASQVLTNTNVKNRVIELMNAGRLGLAPITERLGKWIYDDDAPAQSMDAIKTAYKLHGVLDSDDKQSSATELAVSIQIINASNPIDTNNL